ncbi:MAG: hypothetical protein GY814_14025, partial [Gammaproteobacteria bacterium]|nr:hypothetical protein [Gammaproteobacteria bacterium]
AATKLSNWKNRKGIITSTVSIKTVGNTSAKIKKYIRGRRRNFLSRLRYVLLLGDTNCITTEELSNRNTTDHYYFTSRDANNSNDCVMPWVSGGRIPVNNLSEANAVVEQIIRFEKNPPCDPHYYERMTFAAYFQDNNPQNGQANRAYMNTLENIRTHMVSLDFDIERIYVSNNPNPQLYKDGTAVPAEVRNAIVDDNEATERLLTETAEGQMLVAHRDHGNFSGWAHPSFKNNDLEAIRSAYPSIFYSINCSTGSFDKNADSFAETILTMRGGAPSLIAATELSGTWRNDSLMKGLFDALWPGVISTFPGTTSSYGVRFNRLGDVLNYAKSYLLVAHGSTSGVQDHFEIYHLVGDPTLQVWSEEPSRLGVRARIKKHQLNIHLCPAPADTVITLWYNNRQVKRMKVNSSRISVPLRDLGIRQSLVPSRRMLEVCVSSPGHRFSRIRVRV